MESVGRLVVAYIIGVIGGALDWEFVRKFVKREFISVKEIRNGYIFTYGLMMFGLNTLIAQVSPMFTNTVMVVTSIIIWPLGGLAWGSIMWLTMGDKVEKYLTSIR